MRQQKGQQVRDFIQELPRLRKGPYVFRDTAVFASQFTELRNEMWIGQEANVKDQVGLGGHAILEAEAHQSDRKVLFAGVLGAPELHL